GSILVVVRNQSTLLKPADFERVLEAVRQQVANEFRDAWGISANVVARPDPMVQVPNDFDVVFKDKSDEQGDLGYHFEEDAGWPGAFIFVQDCIDNGDPLASVALSHEIIEMLVDPGANQLASHDEEGQPTKIFPFEACDPVEGDTYDGLNGVKLSNFVTPQYFEDNWPAGSQKFDHLGLVTKPFEIRPGGYMEVMANGKWDTVWGDKANRDKARHRPKRGADGCRNCHRHIQPLGRLHVKIPFCGACLKDVPAHMLQFLLEKAQEAEAPIRKVKVEFGPVPE
ncbi:MAG: hypothetical protein ACREDR_00420, partial [Blastocatellia bacterium]